MRKRIAQLHGLGLNKRMHWSFENPAKFEGTEEEKLAKFREVRDLIEKKIKSWVAEQSGHSS